MLNTQRNHFLESVAHAVAWDAATVSARRAGRQQWSSEDYNVAVATFNRLMAFQPSPYEFSGASWEG